MTLSARNGAGHRDLDGRGLRRPFFTGCRPRHEHDHPAPDDFRQRPLPLRSAGRRGPSPGCAGAGPQICGPRPGAASLVQLVEAETREALTKPGLLSPSRIEVQSDLQNVPFLIDGIEKLFKQYQVQGYQQPVEAVKTQLAQYLDFIRAEVLPKARDDFRLPPELYAFRLE